MVRVRFAPSPTGYLHIGGARTALFNWLFAKKNAGVFILRIEDTDEVRSTEESVQAILEGLEWLGLHWDEGVMRAGKGYVQKGAYGPYFQIERQAIYQRHVQELLQKGMAYRCYCTPEELDQMRRLAHLEKRPPRYDGRCRSLSEKQSRDYESQGRKPVVRFKMSNEGSTVFKDFIHGEVQFENQLLQDFILVKASGIPTYNFACVVDDRLMEISHVIRGDDHLSNTPYQVQLYRAFGWTEPPFAHLSMILGPDGARLSKRHGATSVREYQGNGFLPEALVNYLALLGWSTEDSQQLFALEELIGKFDVARCVKSPATFDPQKLTWMNGEYIRKLSVSELTDRVFPWLHQAKLVVEKTPDLEGIVALEQEKYKLLSDAPRLLDFFFKEAAYDPDSVDKVLRQDGALEILKGMQRKIQGSAEFTAQSAEQLARDFSKERGVKTGQVFHPLRVAVSGRTAGPSLFHMLELLGKERVLSRIQKVLQMLSG